MSLWQKRNIFINIVWENSNENVIPKKNAVYFRPKTTHNYKANNIDLTNQKYHSRKRKNNTPNVPKTKERNRIKQKKPWASDQTIHNMAKQAN